MRYWKALVAFCATLIGHVMAATHRINTSSVDTISNITTIRFTNITDQWGGMGNNSTGPPNWGQILWHEVSVYPDYLGQLGWMFLFCIPFIMLWIAHADMTAAAIVGFLLGAYVAGFIGSQYMAMGIAMMAISTATIVWSMLQKRG